MTLSSNTDWELEYSLVHAAYKGTSKRCEELEAEVIALQDSLALIKQVARDALSLEVSDK